MDDAKELGGKIAKETFDFLIWDDAKTLMDPRASQLEKDVAAAFLMPHGKVFKLAKAGGVIKFVDKGGITAKRKPCKDITMQLTRAKSILQKWKKSQKIMVWN